MTKIIPYITAGFLTMFFAYSAHAQYIPENATFWWMNSDDSVQHYILEVGENPDPAKTFIVLHGGYGAEHSYLINMVLPLSDEYRFVLYDQRGSLRTSAPDSTITFENFVSDLEMLRQNLNLENVNLIGHSNGVNIVLDYLGTYPDQINGAILISGPLSFVHSDAFPEDSDLNSAFQQYSVDLESLRHSITGQIEQKQQELGVFAMEGLSDKELSVRSKISYAGWHTASVNNWRSVQNAFYNPEIMPTLQENVSPETWRERTLRKSTGFVQARVPIRVILGDVDYVDPGGMVWSELINHTKDGKLTILESAGHNSWVDQPEPFRESLRNYLNDLINGKK